MGIGRVLGAVAPVAAGYFGGPALAGTFGATGGAIAAGAMTGAGIAALSGQDVLGGAVTGGLGGFSGGAMGTAAQATKAAEAAKLAQAGAPTGSINSALYGTSPFTSPSVNPTTLAFQEGKAFLPSGYTAPSAITGPQPLAQSIQAGQGPNMGFRSLTSDVAGGGGYQSLGDTFAQSLESGKAAFREPGEFLSQLGDGSKAMGAGRLGLTGLGVAGQAGAFDLEPVDIGPREEEKYDPTSRLNLGMNTGIDKALKRDTGLRLLANGGKVNDYSGEQLASLKQYGVTPQYKTNYNGVGISGITGTKVRQPVQGFVDVGGLFVARKDGDITDVDYEKEYKDIIFGNNKQGSQSGQDANKPVDGGAAASPTDALAKTGLASAYANQQQQGSDFLRSQGLQSLANGGYLPSQDAHFQQSGFGASRLDSLARDYDYTYANGGYLETGGEVGDGMSDEIEATIEGTQEARLSDGEFVIPADVVSHLGNGSSDAGARRLYEMMDKVRMARTGNKKQGKEIKPERYMPA